MLSKEFQNKVRSLQNVSLRDIAKCSICEVHFKTDQTLRIVFNMIWKETTIAVLGISASGVRNICDSKRCTAGP